MLWIFALAGGPKMTNLDLFLFSAAYFPSYWHKPFKRSIISPTETLSAHIISFLCPNCNVTRMFLDIFPDTGLGDGPKNSRIKVKKLFEFFQNYFHDNFYTFELGIITNDCISMEKKSGSERFESISLQNQAFTDYCNHNLTWIRILIFISRTLTSRLCRG